MNTSKLAIYVDAYELVKLVYVAKRQMNKADKADFGAEWWSRTLKLLGHIAMANNCEDKRLEYIDVFISDFEAVKAMLRVGSDLGIIQHKHRIEIAEFVGRIDDQIGRWRAYTLSRQRDAQS